MALKLTRDAQRKHFGRAARVRPKGPEEKLDPLIEALLDEAPRLRRYAHALLAHWPPPPRRKGETRPRVDAEAEAIAVEALFDVARAAPNREDLRCAIYRRVTALARLECARVEGARIEGASNGVDAGRRVFGAAAPLAATRGLRADPRRSASQLAEDPPELWPVELRELKKLDFSARAALALIAIEHFTHDAAAAILDLPTPQLLALLAVARQDLSGAAFGAPRRHLRVVEPDDVALGDVLKYVDGELDPARRDEIGAFLDARPTRARECARWRQVDDHLRQAFGPLLRAPAPRALARALKEKQAKGGFWTRLGRFFAPMAGAAGVAPRPL